MSTVSARSIRSMSLCIAGLLLAVGSVQATTWHVPGDYPTIQAAISAPSTVDGDHVVVAPDTYYERIDFWGKAITVRSTDPDDPAVVAATIIDGGGTGAVVLFRSGEVSTSVLAGFTIRNGGEPGGIRCDASSPTIEHNIIAGNSVPYDGGGIHCYNASPTITSNTIEGNTAGRDGGGIYCEGVSSATIADNLITRNAAGGVGGGIACLAASCPVIRDNTITGNTCDQGGGGIFYFDSSPVITGNTISHNRAANGGGILFVDPPMPPGSDSGPNAGAGAKDAAPWPSRPAIRGNVIRDNAADLNGGGICCWEWAWAEVVGNTISNNTAGQEGGGIYCAWNSLPAIRNNTLQDNTAMAGGGIFCANSACPTITGNAIESNQADVGAGIACLSDASPDITGNALARNSANFDGGGLFCLNASPTIANNAFTCNEASTGGGIWCTGVPSPVIESNTLSGNQAPSGGGGICSLSSSPAIVNSIIAFAAGGGGIYVSGGSPSVRYCDVFGNVDGDYVGMPDQTGINGNISEDPLFADSAADDFHLKSREGRWNPAGPSWWTDGLDSPCIDAGDPASNFTNEPWPNGERANMGVYGNTAEASKTIDRPPTAPALVEVTPGIPGTEDDLIASAGGAIDPDGATLTYEYEWSKTTGGGASWGRWSDKTELDRTAPDGASSNVLDHRLTVKGEAWKARARAYDGSLYGPWAESNPVVIQDTPPTPPTSVAIDPAAPLTRDDLTASASGSADADGDSIAYEYGWAVSGDGTVWGAWANPGEVLLASETTKGEYWKAHARAVADGQSSDWTESAPVTIGNSAPVLAWVGEAPFASTGHAPDEGKPDSTEFTFRVKITDADDSAPQRMFVRVQRLEDGRRWRTRRTWVLAPVSGTWAAGMICEAKMTLPNGVHRYFFYARDPEGAVATGEPRNRQAGPRIIASPQLWCTALSGLEADFLHPNTGTARETRFRFALQYTDGEGAPPYRRRLELQRRRADGKWGAFATLDMSRMSGTATTGRYYTCARKLPAGEYRHRFVFEDDNGFATGAASSGPDATRWQAGPVVSETTLDRATGGAMLSSLAALPSPGGAQIVFSLSTPMTVDARILNIAGRPVKTLFRAKNCESGANTLLWNAQSDQGLHVPNGTYLIEVMAKASDGTQTRGLAQVRISK